MNRRKNISKIIPRGRSFESKQEIIDYDNDSYQQINKKQRHNRKLWQQKNKRQMELVAHKERMKNLESLHQLEKKQGLKNPKTIKLNFDEIKGFEYLPNKKNIGIKQAYIKYADANEKQKNYYAMDIDKPSQQSIHVNVDQRSQQSTHMDIDQQSQQSTHMDVDQQSAHMDINIPILKPKTYKNAELFATDFVSIAFPIQQLNRNIPTQFHDILGRGGFGQTRLVNTPNGLAVMKKSLNRNKQEIQRQYRMLQQANRRIPINKFVNPILLNTSGSDPYFTMQYLQGFDSFENIIQKGINLSKECRLKLSNDIINAVLELNRIGIAHRDIKPANIMINPSTCDFRIIDFGIAITSEQTIAPWMGTFLYTGPSIYRNIEPNGTRKQGQFVIFGQYNFETYIKNDYWNALLVASMLLLPHYDNIIFIESGRPNISNNETTSLALYNLFQQKWTEEWENLLKSFIEEQKRKLKN